jgi:hypothetical protein
MNRPSRLLWLYRWTYAPFGKWGCQRSYGSAKGLRMEPLSLVRPAIKVIEEPNHRHAVRKRRIRLPIWRYKSCRRCGGDLLLQADEYGMEDYTCIQCGASEPSLIQD